MKSSTKPKGATSYKDTIFGIISRQELLKLEIEGTQKGLEHIYTLIKKNEKLKITPEFIMKLHEISFGWIFPKWAGKYRKIQVTFSGKEAPKYYQLPELMLNLRSDLEKQLSNLPKSDEEDFIFEVVKLLAWFQHRFVFIHPFQDYNGRIARMLTIYILLSIDLPPIEVKAETGKDRKRYLTAMQDADEGDFNLLETLIGQALTESLEKLQKTERKTDK